MLAFRQPYFPLVMSRNKPPRGGALAGAWNHRPIFTSSPWFGIPLHTFAQVLTGRRNRNRSEAPVHLSLRNEGYGPFRDDVKSTAMIELPVLARGRHVLECEDIGGAFLQSGIGWMSDNYMVALWRIFPPPNL
jgi:hypothetical protein